MTHSEPIAYRTYRALLRLHPRAFRERFGAEMQWIFAEELRCGDSGARLLLDGTISALRQRFARGPAASLQPQPASFGYLEIGASPVTAARFFQAVALLAFAFSALGSACAVGKGDLGARVMRPFATSFRSPGSGRTVTVTPSPLLPYFHRDVALRQ